MIKLLIKSSVLIMVAALALEVIVIVAVIAAITYMVTAHRTHPPELQP